MPVEHFYTVRASSQGKTLLFFAEEEGKPGVGKSGLSAATTSAAYVREGEGATVIPLVDRVPGQTVEGAFFEVDAVHLPGVYALSAPDALLRQGSTRALVLVRAPGATIRPITIDLVAYDPQDEDRMGVSSLSSERRHEFLRRALPRFTEMELELGRDVESTLKSHLAERKQKSKGKKAQKDEPGAARKKAEKKAKKAEKRAEKKAEKADKKAKKQAEKVADAEKKSKKAKKD